MRTNANRLVFAALLAVLLLAAASAANAQTPAFTIEKVTVSPYNKLLVYNVPGVQEFLETEGTTFVAVEVDINAPWSEEVKDLKVDYKEIKLVSPEGYEIPMMGFFDRYGMFKLSTNSLSAYRPTNWQEDPYVVKYNAMFPVPAGQSKFTFKMGDVSAEIEVPAEMQAVPNPAKTVNIEIKSAKLMDDIKSEYRVGDNQYETVTHNPDGVFLEVVINLTPTMPNGDKPDHFYWNTYWMYLVHEGSLIRPVGERFMGKLSDNVSNNLNKSKEGEWSSKEYTLYYAVPASIKDFSLVYVMATVASGSVQ